MKISKKRINFTNFFACKSFLEKKSHCTIVSELQKDFFHLVSWFSLKKCLKYIFSEFSPNMTLDIEQMCVFSPISFILKCVINPQCSSFFFAKYAKIWTKMSGFPSKNVEYPRYHDTDILQLCLSGGKISKKCQLKLSVVDEYPDIASE